MLRCLSNCDYCKDCCSFTRLTDDHCPSLCPSTSITPQVCLSVPEIACLRHRISIASASMCFFLPISPLSEVFRPEDELPAYHGACRGTVNIVKVVALTTEEKQRSPTYQDSVVRVIPSPKSGPPAYYDKCFPPFPPDAKVDPRVVPRSQVYTPGYRGRDSGSSGGSSSFGKPQPDRRRSRSWLRRLRGP